MIGTRQASAKQNSFFDFICGVLSQRIYNYSTYNIIFRAKSQEQSIKNNSRFKKSRSNFDLKIYVFKLIFGVDLWAERFALEGIVKELAAFVSCADNAESVADHLGTVALEGCGVLAEFAALRAFVFIGAGVRDFINAVAFFNR